jgi:hypothetical protein
MLIFVEGTDSATDLSGAGRLPVVLSGPGHLVYSVQSVSSAVTSYDQWVSTMQDSWGYLVGSDPLLIGAFGTCNSADSCVDSPDPAQPGDWFTIFMRYLSSHNLSSAYWALNGTTSDQAPETRVHYGQAESHGLLNTTWSGVALPPLLSAVRAAQPSCPTGSLAGGTYYIP